MFRLTSLLLLLAACNADKDDDTDTGPDTDTQPLCDVDVDEDGSCADVDCDDNNPLVSPDAPDIPYNGRDEDCDGSDLVDVDGDGFIGVGGGGDDCNDGNPTIFPGAEEECYSLVDLNCDGVFAQDDCDLDGTPKQDDCDDMDPDIYPGAPDAFYDGVDSDCGRDSDFDQDGDGDDLEWQDGWPGDFPVKIWTSEGQIDRPETIDDWHGRDCADLDPLVGGGLPEPWDGVDRNCDGVVDRISDRDALSGWNGHVGLGDDAMGASVALLGDLDGDGWADVAAGDMAANQYSGRVYVHSSATSGRADLAPPLATIDGGQDEYFGWAVADAGDLNGDGLSELLAGGVLVLSPGGNTGVTLLFDGADLTGQATLTLGDALAVMEGGPLVGLNNVSAGDVSGPTGPDGVPDVIAASGAYAPVWAGVFSGADLGAGGIFGLGSVSALVTNDTLLGGGLAADEDVTGDGLPDLALAGNTCYTDPQGTAGGVFLVDGSLLNGSAVIDPLTMPQVTGGPCIGATVGLLGDVDGDGYGQVMVGSPTLNNGAGAVYVISSQDFDPLGLPADTAASFTVDGAGSSGFLRIERRAGDHDGDGSPDLLVGAPGVYDTFQALQGQPVSGNGGVFWYPSPIVAAGGTVTSADAHATFTHRSTQVAFGVSFDVAPINPEDGLADVMISASNQGAGNTFIYLSSLSGP